MMKFSKSNIRPDRMSVPIMTPKVKKAKPMTFETALRHLRRGKAVRRRAWHAESRIFRLGNEIFLKLPHYFHAEKRPGLGEAYGSAPDFWKPYPGDFLATDWEIAK